MSVENSCLLIASNPNPNSLTVHAANCACDALLQSQIDAELIHLDTLFFNPILSQEDIERRYSFDEQVIHFQKLIQTKKVLGLFFPSWWGLPPALLVGWIQRVFIPGFAFAYTGGEFMAKEKEGLLSHLQICLVVSSDEKDVDMTMMGIHALTQHLFSPSGVTQVKHSILCDTRNTSIRQKNEWFSHNSKLLSGLVLGSQN